MTRNELSFVRGKEASYSRVLLCPDFSDHQGGKMKRLTEKAKARQRRIMRKRMRLGRDGNRKTPKDNVDSEVSILRQIPSECWGAAGRTLPPCDWKSPGQLQSVIDVPGFGAC